MDSVSIMMDMLIVFYVHYKYQNCGIGKLLLNHIFKIAKENNTDKIKADVT